MTTPSQPPFSSLLRVPSAPASATEWPRAIRTTFGLAETIALVDEQQRRVDANRFPTPRVYDGDEGWGGEYGGGK